MNYVSCFSGIGGLEATQPPLAFCEADPVSADVLRARHPETPIWNDVRDFDPPLADVVAGGWPCQDLSIAGRQAGLRGSRSGLLADMLEVARRARAHTVVAENVPNLLRLSAGREFSALLSGMADAGYRFVAWRVVNARELGLAQNRRRLMIIASKEQAIPLVLFRPLPQPADTPARVTTPETAAGFYWTAGTHSINYSSGYVPAIKVGSSLGIASPPAVHYADVVRLVSPREALDLQGFLDVNVDAFPRSNDAYRAAGNAVPRPLGRWVLDGVLKGAPGARPEWMETQCALWTDPEGARLFPPSGVYCDGDVTPVRAKPAVLAVNLAAFLDADAPERLSQRAARGLLGRLEKAGRLVPLDLLAVLNELAFVNDSGCAA